MGGEYTADWGRTIASALDWWREAGVETLQEDAARDWLARPAPAREAAPALASPAPEALPDTIAAFLAWRTGEAAPEAEWMTPRIGASGPVDAEWVIVTDMPEAEDMDALLSGGAAGRLFGRMLAAIGLARDSVHLLPLAVARPLTGRIPPEQEGRLYQLARHHLKLIQPKKLLLLGQAAGRLVPEAADSSGGNGLEVINHFGGKTEVVASYHPRFLLERPAAKSEAWKHLLLLSRGSL